MGGIKHLTSDPAIEPEPGETCFLSRLTQDRGVGCLPLISAELRLNRWIGREVFDAHPYGRDEFHDRWFFHLTCDEPPPERWRHGESAAANGSHDVIPFEFFWIDLVGNMPALIAGHDRFIGQLKRSLKGPRS